MRSVLDNPIWHSLTSRHSHLALGSELARRYPAHIAPFAAVADASAEAGSDLGGLVQPGERVGLLNVTPKQWLGWTVEKNMDVAQYVWDKPITEPDLEAVPLGSEHVDLMLDLTRLVYPAYFRQGTAELGDYFGILQNGQLCAMAGIRMACDGHQEISAVCTHPDHRGKGFASRLTRHVIHHIATQGDVAFLHTESDNDPARAIYDRLGFSLRRIIPFYLIERNAGT